MAPILKQFALRRREKKTPGERDDEGVVASDNPPASGGTPALDGAQEEDSRGKKTGRRNWVILSSLFYFISLIFLILVSVSGSLEDILQKLTC